MSENRQATCKRCGTEIVYSARALEKMLAKGQSRPEYCENCRQEHKQELTAFASPYFDLNRLETYLRVHGVGQLSREVRHHVTVALKTLFDESRFGLTREKIIELADWFSNSSHRVAVVVGPTGSGKSTLLPLWLGFVPEDIALEPDFFTKEGQILVAQPRILATDTLADFIGKILLGTGVGKGQDVGASHSKRKDTDWTNTIAQLTHGQLVEKLGKHTLPYYCLVMIDEGHERTGDIDLLLKRLKLMLLFYPNFRLIVTSATIDANKFQSYFGDELCTIINFEGKTRVDIKTGQEIEKKVIFADGTVRIYKGSDPNRPYEQLVEPVTSQDAHMFYQPFQLDPKDLKSYIQFCLKAKQQQAYGLLKAMVQGVIEEGDILSFLPGKPYINQSVEALRKTVAGDPELQDRVVVYPLYRELPEDEKDLIINKPDPSKIMVVFSTNIAEASVTIDTIVYEIETGLENQKIWYPDKKEEKLETVLTSQGNAQQRWGRCARTRSGVIYCLYTLEQYEVSLNEYPTPEIQRSNLEKLLLNALATGDDNLLQGWLDSPPKAEFDRSMQALKKVGAVDSRGFITELGLTQRYDVRTDYLELAMNLADEAGVLIEVASLLPVIRNGGFRGLLEWKNSWDETTKVQRLTQFQFLSLSQVDDISFILTLLSLWETPPWVDSEKFAKLKPRHQEQIRSEFSNMFGLNHALIRDRIQKEKLEILKRYYVKTKTSHIRPIDLKLIPVVASLMRSMSPSYPHEGGAIEADELFRYRLRPKNPSNLSSKFPFRVAFRKGYRDYPIETFILPYLLPADATYLVEVNYPEVKIKTIDYNRVKRTPELANISHALLNSKVRMVLETKKQVKNGLTVKASLVRLEFQEDQLVAYFEPLPTEDPFTNFCGHYTVGDAVNVAFLRYLEDPIGELQALLVKELETGLEIPIYPKDISYLDSKRFGQLFSKSPLNEELMPLLHNLKVEHIFKDNRQVRLSNWDSLTQTLSQVYEIEGVFPLSLLRRTGSRYFFKIDPIGGSYYKDIPFLTILNGVTVEYDFSQTRFDQEMKRKIDDGEDVDAEIRPTYGAEVSLEFLPNEITHLVPQKWLQAKLWWNKGFLRFSDPDPMTYEELHTYKAWSESQEFHLALEELFWLSNQPKIVDLFSYW